MTTADWNDKMRNNNQHRFYILEFPIYIPISKLLLDKYVKVSSISSESFGSLRINQEQNLKDKINFSSSSLRIKIETFETEEAKNLWFQ